MTIDAMVWAGAELLVWMEGQPLLSSAIATVLVLPAIIGCWLAHRVGLISRPALRRSETAVPGDAAGQLDVRLAKICTAVELLTDTTESALRDAFLAIERLSSHPHPAPAPRSVGIRRRVRRAAERGDSARALAVAEGVAEGEAHLRLRLEAERRPAASVPGAVN